MSRRQLSLLIIVAMFLATAAGVYWIRAAEAPKNAARTTLPVPVEVLRVTPRDFTHRLEALGTVQAVREASVGVKVSGPIAALPPAVELGTFLEAGALIAQVDPTPFAIEVEHKEALVARAHAQLRIRRAEIVRQRSLIEINREKLRLAQTEYDRLKSLYDDGGIAWVEVKAVELALRRTDEEMERAESGLREADAQLGVAEAEVAAARAELARARQALADTEIRAPFAGIISKKTVTLGEQVAPGTVLVTLADISAVKILIRIPSDDIATLKPGEAAEVSLSGFSEPMRGRVGYIGPRADPETRTFPVEVLVENRGARRLLPGMFARVTIAVRAYPAAILIPRSSLSTAGDEASVFVVDSGEGVARKRSVHVARTFGSQLLIGGGLKADDLLVVLGHRLLRDGAAVRVAATRDQAP